MYVHKNFHSVDCGFETCCLYCIATIIFTGVFLITYSVDYQLSASIYIIANFRNVLKLAQGTQRITRIIVIIIVTGFWKTYHLHTNEIIKNFNFAALRL